MEKEISKSIIIKPEDKEACPKWTCSIFLAGSIEMGAAEDWQTKVENAISEYPVNIFNPRRDDWDSSWEQKESNKEFNYQVNWELNKLEESEIIFMYFDKNSKSPISLLELGKFSESRRMIVVCPDGFWRKGNVQILCNRENIPIYNDLESGIGALITRINDMNI